MRKLDPLNDRLRRAATLAFIPTLLPSMRALASSGPEVPFDDPIWKALVGTAILINGFLYFLVWRRRVN